MSAAAWGDDVRVGLILVGNTIRDFNATGVEVYADGATGASGEAVVAHNRFILRRDVLSRHRPAALRDRGRVAISARDVVAHVIGNVVSGQRGEASLDGILLEGAQPDVRGNLLRRVRTGISGHEGWPAIVGDNRLLDEGRAESSAGFDLLLLYPSPGLAEVGGQALTSSGENEVRLQRASIVLADDKVEAIDGEDHPESFRVDGRSRP